MCMHWMSFHDWAENFIFQATYEPHKFRPDNLFLYKLVLSSPLVILHCFKNEALCEVYIYPFVTWCHRLQIWALSL